MAVAKQLVPIPFASGLDTKTDDRQTPAGKLLELKNGQFTKTGAISKRYGYRALSRAIEGGTTIDAAQAISSFKDELVLFSGSRVYSYVTAVGKWLDRGAAISVIAIDRQILRTNNTQQLNPDVAYSNGVEMYAWEDSTGGVRYSVVDADTGAFVVSSGLVNATAGKPRLAAFNNRIYAFYTDGINNLLRKDVAPLSPTTISVESTVFADLSAFSSFDVIASPDGTALYLAYLSSATAGTIFVAKYTAGATLVGLATVATGANATDGSHSAVDLCATAAGNVWVSWSTGAHVKTACFDSALVPVLAATNIQDVRAETLTGVEHSTVGNLQLCYETYDATPSKRTVVSKTVTVGGAVASVGTLRSVGLSSRAFAGPASRYVNVAHESTFQSTYFTIDISAAPFNVVAKINATVGGGLRTNNMVSCIVEPATNVFLWANSIKDKLISEANTTFSLLGVSSTRLDYANTDRFLSTTFSDSLLFVGGILNSYDGVSVTEHSFHLYPEGVTAAPAGADGSLSTGQYQYAVCYEWTDNAGQIQRSAPSVPVTVNAVATNHCTVTAPTLRITAKQGTRTAPNIVIYRTTADGTLFFRVTSSVAPLHNDPTVDTVQFVDVASDTSIQSNELLYTTGNVLDNAAPPACKLISLFNNRVVVSGLEDQNLIWFSKNKFDNTNFNTIPAEFAAELTIGVNPRGGAITALGLLDEKLIIFKESALFALAGDGPNDTGAGETFADPAFVTADAGCKNPNSVITTPVGLMFQSDKGIYLLDRSLQATYIGAPVEAFNSEVITSATLNQNSNQVIFTTTSGTALVYDYYAQQWATWTNHSAEDSDLFEGVFTYVKNTGNVYVQDSTMFTDAGKPVFLSWTTANLSFAGLAGYQRAFRCYLLGHYKSAHSLDISVAFDYNPSYEQFATVDASQGISVWGGDATWGSSSPWGGEYVPYLHRVDFARQRCTSIRLKVTDSQSSNYGEGYAISAVVFEVGAMPGGNRNPASRIVGTE